MDMLHLVVHRSLIEESLEAAMSDDGRHQEEAALKRIDEIAQVHPDNVRFVEDADLSNPERFCNGYSHVILYGCTRIICLDKVAKDLHKAGVSVAYDITGTTD